LKIIISPFFNTKLAMLSRKNMTYIGFVALGVGAVVLYNYYKNMKSTTAPASVPAGTTPAASLMGRRVVDGFIGKTTV
jgi:predicted transcriptional regulator